MGYLNLKEVRKKPQWVMRLKWSFMGHFSSGVRVFLLSFYIFWWLQRNRKWGQPSFQSTSLDLPQEMHHMSSVVRDVDVVMVLRHFSPKIGLSVNPCFHWANSFHPTVPLQSISLWSVIKSCFPSVLQRRKHQSNIRGRMVNQSDMISLRWRFG